MKSDREAVNSLARRIQDSAEKSGQKLTHQAAKKIVITNLQKSKKHN